MGYRLLDTWTGEHLDDEHPDRDTGEYSEFDTREEAFKALPKHWPNGRAIVCFVLEDHERDAWDRRMRGRFQDGSYRRIPDLNYTSLAEYLHYPHMSNKQPGNIAYTPSEEYGFLDRQVSTTPGRYLEKFYPADTFTQVERERFIAQCQQAAEDRKLKFAVTADDIESVYTTSGPNSCMSHSVEDYRSEVHPVRVYGDSDLQVAYIGTLGLKISARAVVWPERKTYVRTYGANTLIQAELERLGYTRDTDLDGAHVRLIEEYRGIVMPFIDGCDGASVSRTRRGFVVLGSGSISTSETNGLGTENETTYRSCDRCGDEYDTEADDATNDYCAGCAPNRAECAQCSRGIWTDANDVFEYGDSHLCARCHREHGNECVRCSETWYSFDFGTRERQSRRDANQDSMCADCANDGWIECAECGEACEPIEDTLMCSECAESSEEPIAAPTPRCEHTADLFEPRPVVCDGSNIKPDVIYTLVRVQVTNKTELLRCYFGPGAYATRLGTVDGLFERMSEMQRLYPHEKYAVVETVSPLPEMLSCPGFELEIG